MGHLQIGFEIIEEVCFTFEWLWDLRNLQLSQIWTTVYLLVWHMLIRNLKIIV